MVRDIAKTLVLQQFTEVFKDESSHNPRQTSSVFVGDQILAQSYQAVMPDSKRLQSSLPQPFV